MYLVVISALILCALASPIPGGGYGGGIIGGGIGVGGIGGGGYGGEIGYGGGGYKCGPKQALNALGKCVDPILTRNTFLYNSPPTPYIELPPPIVPTPKIDYDLVFLRSPEVLPPPEPIIVPANERRTAVYLLNKNQPVYPQKVIEVPAPPQQSPEVFYVNYDYGDNPVLPGGVSLKEALAAADVQQGQLIEGGVGGGYGVGVGVAKGGEYNH